MYANWDWSDGIFGMLSLQGSQNNLWIHTHVNISEKKTTFCVFHMFMVHFISLNLRDTFCKKSLFFYVSCILTYKGLKHVSIFYTCLLYGCLDPPYALVVTFWVFFGDVSIVSYADNVHSFLEQYFWDPSSENFSENSKIIFSKNTC